MPQWIPGTERQRRVANGVDPDEDVDLALAIPDEPDGDRSTRFAEWHTTMRTAAERLLARAQEARAVRPEVTAADLLALAGSIALTGRTPAGLDAMLELVRDGYRA